MCLVGGGVVSVSGRGGREVGGGGGQAGGGRVVVTDGGGGQTRGIKLSPPAGLLLHLCLGLQQGRHAGLGGGAGSRVD